MTDTLHSATPAESGRSVEDVAAVFESLDDRYCRQVLEAISTEPMTGPELAEACDIPTSTVYRKLDVLADSPLVEQRIRFDTDSKPATEYRCRFDVLRVGFDDGGLSVELSPADAGAPPP